MWLSETSGNSQPRLPRRAVLLGGLAALAGCGFRPALAPGGSLERLRNRISFPDPADRNGFVLISELERRLGAGREYAMSIEISTTERDAGITPDQVITRRLIDGRADFALSDAASGFVHVSGAVTAFTSYGTTGTTASTDFAREAAFERLMTMLADEILAELAIAPVAS